MSLLSELKRRNVFRVAAAYMATGWLLIQVAGTVLSAFVDSEAPTRIVTILVAVGFIPTLVFAWVFELTPDGFRRERAITPDTPITGQSGRRLDRVIIMVLGLAVTYFLLDEFLLEPGRQTKLERESAEQLAKATEQARRSGRDEALAGSPAEPSIAVLPFADLSPGKDQTYLSDGLAEELLSLLAKIPELRVISRTSAFSYRDRAVRLTQVAEELGVSHILEGSVRPAGDRLRVTVQLIDGRSDAHLWAETYDRPLNDIFVLQDEIAATVVERLKVALLNPTPHARTTDPQAYALYLRARYLIRLSSPESFEQARTLLHQVLEIDPNYVPAWDSLAQSYVNQARSGLIPVEEGAAQGRRMAAQALAIDPAYAPAHARLAWIEATYGNDAALAAQHLDRGFALAPTDGTVLSTAAALAQWLGRLDQAVALGEYIVARDPVGPISHNNLGYAYLLAGRWDDAIATLRTALALSPNYTGPHYTIGLALLLKGDAEAALAEFAQEAGDEEFRIKGRALALFSLGDSAGFEAAVSELAERWGGEWPSEVAQVYAWAGENDAAFEWLGRAVAIGEEGLNQQHSLPIYRSLHDDPRWLEFRGRTGTAPEQLDAIPLRVTAPEP